MVIYRSVETVFKVDGFDLTGLPGLGISSEFCLSVLDIASLLKLLECDRMENWYHLILERCVEYYEFIESYNSIHLLKYNF